LFPELLLIIAFVKSWFVCTNSLRAAAEGDQPWYRTHQCPDRRL